jgi:cysteinyl-tRNA synthetase
MKLYNTPDKKVVELNLDKAKPVKIYTCGPTVYDYPHIGNWYTFIRYDLLVRSLRATGYEVNWVMNITDVGHLVSDADSGEDKLEKGAKREHKTAQEVAEFYGDYFLNGLKRLNFAEVTHLPKATDFIKEQIELISKLEEKGFVYKTSDGVYFDTSKFPKYADFAHLNLNQQQAGDRVEINTEKRQESDFSVWKFSTPGQKRDMEWDSPWGKGFPGWHLECSAMIQAILGQPIDIHAGGIDHIAVHHTNEIAQSEAAFDLPLSMYWMHCNHILVDGKKMSKSDGTIITLEDIETKGYSLDVFRFHVLSGHYRSQSEFSWELLEASKKRYEQFVAMSNLRFQPIGKSDWLGAATGIDTAKNEMQNDLNTPLALSFLGGLVANTNDRLISPNDLNSLTSLVIQIDELFGTKLSEQKDITKEQAALIKERDAFRKQNDYQKADEVKARLEKEGITLRDTPNGTVWSRFV